MPVGKVGREGEEGSWLYGNYEGWRENNIMRVWSAKVKGNGLKKRLKGTSHTTVEQDEREGVSATLTARTRNFRYARRGWSSTPRNLVIRELGPIRGAVGVLHV